MTMSLMYINHFLHLIVTSHEDTRPIMDVFRHDRQHAIHAAVDRLTAGWRSSINVSKDYPYFYLWGGRRVVQLHHVPFSKTMAMGAHSYNILSFPLGLFLSAGYAKMPP